MGKRSEKERCTICENIVLSLTAKYIDGKMFQKIARFGVKIGRRHVVKNPKFDPEKKYPIDEQCAIKIAAWESSEEYRWLQELSVQFCNELNNIEFNESDSESDTGDENEGSDSDSSELVIRHINGSESEEEEMPGHNDSNIVDVQVQSTSAARMRPPRSSSSQKKAPMQPTSSQRKRKLGRYEKEYSKGFVYSGPDLNDLGRRRSPRIRNMRKKAERDGTRTRSLRDISPASTILSGLPDASRNRPRQGVTHNQVRRLVNIAKRRLSTASIGSVASFASLAHARGNKQRRTTKTLDYKNRRGGKKGVDKLKSSPLPQRKPQGKTNAKLKENDSKKTGKKEIPPKKVARLKKPTPPKKAAPPKKPTPPKKPAPSKKAAPPKKPTPPKKAVSPKKPAPSKKAAPPKKPTPPKKAVASKKAVAPKKAAPAKKKPRFEYVCQFCGYSFSIDEFNSHLKNFHRINV